MARHTQIVEQLDYSEEELRLAAIDVHVPPSSGESNTDKFHGCAKKRFARMFYDQTDSIICLIITFERLNLIRFQAL